MRHPGILLVALLTSVFLLLASPARAVSIFLDFDTPATGSNIITIPLVTSEGTITAILAELVTFTTDPEFNAAGASGNKIDHLGSPSVAALVFDFDVASISLIYGGNAGDITINARNAANVLLDTFFQADTGNGQPAGPISLSGLGIRRLEWFESDGNFAGLDNITFETVATPVPGTLALCLLGVAALALGARRRARRR